MPFKKSQNLPFGRDGQETQGRFDQKLVFLFFSPKMIENTKKSYFFLFFTKNDIKTLFELCIQETFNFWNKGFSCQFQGIKLKFSGPAFDHPRQTRQYETFDWDQLGNLFWRLFSFVLTEKIQALEQKVFTAKFHIK